jgi:SAM-dependent methyltransferase
MKLSDLLQRGTPEPWAEGDNIPWNEPGFSRRMLKEHLSQEHDAASRRFATIDQHVCFIHEQVLGAKPGQVLDLACGPGLYTHRLARLGQRVHGIDFSPASIAYARQLAESEGLACTYDLCDVRAAGFGPDSTYDLAMFLYGEFNVFQEPAARDILRRACAALKPGGLLLLEPSPEGYVEWMGRQPANWYTQESGLFSDDAYMLLEESFWNAERRVATNRYYSVDVASGDISHYAASYQAYSDAEFQTLVEGSGFTDVRILPNLTGEGERAKELFVMLARKGEVVGS